MMLLSNPSKKFVASIFIGSGLLMILPGVGDAIVNIPLAKYISANFNTTLLIALISTYTIVPLALIWIGSLIYPPHKQILHRTTSKLSNRITTFINNLKTDRKTQFVTLIIILIIYNLVQVHREWIAPLLK